MTQAPPPSALLAMRADGRSPGAAVSLEQAYEAHFDFVWRNARRLGVSEASADDVVQDVFLVVHRRLGDFQGGSMRAWILGILVRVVSDHRRTHRRKDAHLVPLEPEVVSTGRDPMVLAESAERARMLEELLAELTEEQRLLLLLADLEEWKLREIAAYFNANINTIYSRLRAARRAFERVYALRLGTRKETP